MAPSLQASMDVLHAYTSMSDRDEETVAWTLRLPLYDREGTTKATDFCSGTPKPYAIVLAILIKTESFGNASSVASMAAFPRSCNCHTWNATCTRHLARQVTLFLYYMSPLTHHSLSSWTRITASWFKKSPPFSPGNSLH
jgi:hypothetical protein